MSLLSFYMLHSFSILILFSVTRWSILVRLYRLYWLCCDIIPSKVHSYRRQYHPYYLTIKNSVYYLIEKKSLILFIKHELFYSKYTFIFEKPKYNWKVAEVKLLWITFFIYSLPQYVTSIFFSILLKVDDYEIYLFDSAKHGKLRNYRYIISFNCFAFNINCIYWFLICTLQ